MTLEGNRKFWLGVLIVLAGSVLVVTGQLSVDLWLATVGGVYGGFVVGNGVEHAAAARTAEARARIAAPLAPLPPPVPSPPVPPDGPA